MKKLFRSTRVVFPALMLLAATLWLASIAMSAQSLSYSSGQIVVPGYEGWQEDADGTKYFVFGYMNRNWEEELDLPVGPDNNFNVGAPDQGQPTHFLPRRNRFVFRVRVPQGFTETNELVWTLTSKGKTEKAYASLRLDYKIDEVVMASETGALGAGTSSPTMRANKAPAVKLEGPATRTTKAGQPLALVVTLTDDGIPKAFTEDELTAALVARARAASSANAAALGEAGRGAATPPAGSASGGAAPAAAPRLNPALLPPTRVTVGKNLGLHLSWFVYRGAGKVTFTPTQVKAWEDTRAGANSPWSPLWFAAPLPADGKITVDVKFDDPGTYVLRALADDGALTGGENLTVTVTP